MLPGTSTGKNTASWNVFPIIHQFSKSSLPFRLQLWSRFDRGNMLGDAFEHLFWNSFEWFVDVFDSAGFDRAITKLDRNLFLFSINPFDKPLETVPEQMYERI